MTRRHALFAALCLGLAACDSSDSGKIPLRDYEGPAGEAAIRHLITQLPDLNPGVPKSYSVILGEINRDGMTPASKEFANRFADLKLKFIYAFNLQDLPPDHVVVDPETRTACFLLQIRTLEQTAPDAWTTEVAWSYKKDFGCLKLKLTQKDGKVSVIQDEKLETSIK